MTITLTPEIETLIAEKIGSGGTILIDDSTTLAIAPNITPDKETGAGTWTDDMLARAIREGVGHDFTVIFPITAGCQPCRQVVPFGGCKG